MRLNNLSEKVLCYHCGDQCEAEHIQFEDHDFCCHGCKSVYELLRSCDLDGYYTYADNPGIKTLKAPSSEKFSFLEDESIQIKLLSFKSDKLAKVSLRLPAMHCASCIWLIENFRKLVPGVIESRVNFMKREATFSYEPDIVTLRRLVEQLAAIGYEPELNLDSTSKKKSGKHNLKLITQLGVAGFCFGNIMLLSFPEYLSVAEELTNQYRSFFGYLNFVLALPVLLYSAGDYLRSAKRAVLDRAINMDVPISMGILAIFFRSTYEIFLEGGGGYMDSLAALVFFLLIGKWFQQKTYDSLSFERDFKSYFPISVQLVDGEKERAIGIESLNRGDRFRIRSGELIPVDSILIDGESKIDYSFVSGESEPVHVENGAGLFAGGRQMGASIVLEATKTVDQSYLTGLWNSDENKEENKLESFADRVGRVFTYVILFIALSAGIFWMIFDPSLVLNAVSAVLIIACPCALALSFPFAYGNAIRLTGRKGLYLKNATALSRMAEVTHIIFDKTGTLTRSSESKVEMKIFSLTPSDKSVALTMASQSGHPLSRMIVKSLKEDTGSLEITGFTEVKGKGLCAVYQGIEFRLGSAEFVGDTKMNRNGKNASQVFLSRNGEVVAVFSIYKEYRSGLRTLISKLKKLYSLYMLSGDNDAEKERMSDFFGQRDGLLFNQLPHQKREFIAKLRKQGAVTAMVGDGLNDAAALKESDLGISVADDVFRFAPASDAILSSDGFHRLPDFFRFSKDVLKTVRWSFILSFIYNGIGLFFAVQGVLTPVIAAILMPVSSISVVAFVTLRTTYFYRKRLVK